MEYFKLDFNPDKRLSIFSGSSSGSESWHVKLLHDLEHHSVLTCIVIFIILLLGYIIIGSWMETKHFSIGHETGVIIIVAIIVSTLLELWTGNNIKII